MDYPKCLRSISNPPVFGPALNHASGSIEMARHSQTLERLDEEPDPSDLYWIPNQ